MRDLKWIDYTKKYHTDGLFFYDTHNNIFVVAREGTGDNLLPEDEDEGYVDYWNVEVYSNEGNIGGGMLMETKLIQEVNPTVSEIIYDLIDRSDMLDGVEGINLRDMLIDPEVGEAIEYLFFNKEMAKLNNK